MIRHALVLGALGVLAGCSSVERNGDAATVEGTAVTIDDFESMLDDVLTSPQVFRIEANTTTGTVDAGPGRAVLGLMIRSEASAQFLEGAGESITDEDRQVVREQVGEDDPLFSLPDDLVSYFVDVNAAAEARARIEAPDAAELERLYTTSPEQLGVVCVRQVVVATEAEADDVLDEIRDGGDIEAIAVERSIDPLAATNGGALDSGGRECISTAEASQGNAPELMAAAVMTTPGNPVGPVQTPLGWHVVEAGPFDEVDNSLTALYDEQAGELMFAGFLASADVTVDPRYGRWEGASGTVVEL